MEVAGHQYHSDRTQDKLENGGYFLSWPGHLALPGTSHGLCSPLQVSLLTCVCQFPYVQLLTIWITARYFARQSITGGNRSVPLSQQRQDPQAIAARFLREFEDQYGTSHVDFFAGGYSQALESAKRQLNFLMVVLQSDEHDDTSTFCRYVIQYLKSYFTYDLVTQ